MCKVTDGLEQSSLLYILIAATVGTCPSRRYLLWSGITFSFTLILKNGQLFSTI
jgi:hypothetical protein